LAGHAELLRYILETVPDGQPFEVAVGEDDLPMWLSLYKEIRGREFELLRPLSDAGGAP
jgi:hypothetical protein